MVFHSKTASYPWYLRDEDKRQVIIEMDAQAMSKDIHELEPLLRERLPHVPAMRRAIETTGLHFAVRF